MSADPLPQPGLRYGALGFPLAFVALPLAVHLPDHYARQYGVPLAALGAMLLAVRAGDAFVDPLLGRWADRLLRHPQSRLVALCMGLAALVLSLSLHGLLTPPDALLKTEDWQPLLAWSTALLMLAYLAYSFLMVVHQAWGTALGADASTRSRVVAWREGCALVGVVVASILPSLIGMAGMAVALTLALAAALTALWGTPRPSLQQAMGLAGGSLTAPWKDGRFSRLMVIYILNGVASAIPATLLMFYLGDRLGARDAQALCLGLYFLAATASLPLWVRLALRLGLARTWMLGMVLAIVSFIWAAFLPTGAVSSFAVICMASGLALGADISAAPAMLAGLRPNSATRSGASSDDEAGLRFGWWNLASKLNLALAAGLSLPALQWLGYDPANPSPQGVQVLTWMYGMLPCVLKTGAAALLWLLWIRKDPVHDPF